MSAVPYHRRHGARRVGLASALALAAAITGTVGTAVRAQPPSPVVAHADYRDPALWLCRPGLAIDRCRVDLDATVIRGDGVTTVEHYTPAAAAPIDCFFVYPTVSRDPGWQSDFVPGAAEIDDVKEQFARFGAACRQFAPMYRQNTLTALRRNAGGPQPVGEKLPDGVGGYADILDAWNWYLANENHGRGVVLIGHSQGAALIARLLAQEIDGKPAQARLVSALVLGAPVYVPADADVGGSFRTVPLCRRQDQTGCVISYATFRDAYPPPPQSRFGRARDGLRVACTNPAALAGGAGTPRPYFVTHGFLNDAGGTTQPPWLTPERAIATPFVTTPGLVTTRCLRSGEFDWLSLQVNADPRGRRTNRIAGEIVRPSGIDYSWGLHILDVDHSMGTLVTIVAAQGRAWHARHAAR